MKVKTQIRPGVIRLFRIATILNNLRHIIYTVLKELEYTLNLKFLSCHSLYHCAHPLEWRQEAITFPISSPIILLPKILFLCQKMHIDITNSSLNAADIVECT